MSWLWGPVPGGLAGGERRQDSVSNGLSAVPDDIELIAVHDAARPLAPGSLVADMLAVLEQTDATAVVPTLPLRDTVKEISASATVIRDARPNPVGGRPDSPAVPG